MTNWMIARLVKLVAVLVLVVAPAVSTAMESTITFSARVADSGRPVAGAHVFVFSFWDVDSGGAFDADQIWSTTASLTVSDGVVTTVLGGEPANPFPAVLFNGSRRWLEVSMDGVAFSPRLEIQAVPYALRAKVADDLQCTGCVSDAEIVSISASKVSGTVTNAGYANSANYANSATNANYANSAGSATNANYASSAGTVAWSGVSGRPTTITCSSYSSAALTVNAGGTASSTVYCGAGVMTGGGFVSGGTNVAVSESHPSGNGWYAYIKNNDPSASTFYVTVRCCWL